MSMFSEPWLSVMVDVVFEGLIVHDGERITDANARVARMFGFDDAAEMVGLPCRALLSPEGFAEAERRIASGADGRYRALCRHRDGSDFTLDIQVKETRYGERRARIVAFRYPDDEHPVDNPLVQRMMALDNTVRALAGTIEQRDSFTAGHHDRVSEIAVRIADRMGVGARSLATIRLAGNVHDIGKVGVPAEILMKPGPLTADE
jgi:PAS domain S-box-containing protein